AGLRLFTPTAPRRHCCASRASFRSPGRRPSRGWSPRQWTSSHFSSAPRKDGVSEKSHTGARSTPSVAPTSSSRYAPSTWRPNMRDYSALVMVLVWGIVQIMTISAAEAAPTGPAMPWDGPLNTILGSLSGTVAHVLITVAVIVTGL